MTPIVRGRTGGWGVVYLASLAGLCVACGDTSGPERTSAADIAFAVQSHRDGDFRGVYVQSLDSGSVAVPLEVDRAVTWLDWSPDGRFIAYSGGSGAIRVLDVDHQPDAYTLLPAGESVAGFPMWSPDGSRIAYAHAFGLWVISASRSTAPVNLSQHYGGDITYPDWSPDGTRIAYEWGHGLLWIAEANGSAAWRIPIYEDGQGSNNYGSWGYAPHWSPDGSRIAYHNKGVWTVAIDGSDRRTMTPNCDDAGACGREGVYYSAQWSPEGTRLVFSGRDHPDSAIARVYVVNADGTELRQLTDGHQDAEPQWAPGGDQILFSRNYGWDERHLMVIRLDGTGERPVTAGNGQQTFPRWRPPGGGE